MSNRAFVMAAAVQLVTWHGSAWAQPSCPAPLGGNMLQFDGADDVCRVPVAPQHVLPEAMTLEAWVNPDFAVRSGVAGRWGTGGASDSYLLYLDDGGRPEARIVLSGIPGQTFAEDDNPLQTGEWTHLAMTFDGQQLKLYRAGMLVEAVAAVGTLADADNIDIRFGIEDIIAGEVNYFRGALDEIRLWRVARMDEEILNTRDLTIADPYCEPNLVGLWRLDETLGLQTIVDATRFANHGTRGDDGGAAGDDPTRLASTAPIANFPDCNGNSDHDACDIDNGTSDDDNGNGIPDACECPWDLDVSGAVDTPDFLALLANWGPGPVGPPDFDCNGDVGATDFLSLLANWGPCP